MGNAWQRAPASWTIMLQLPSTCSYGLEQLIKRELTEFGKHVGERMVDVVYRREKPLKRDTRLYNALVFLKSTFWKSVFGKEADELERDGVNENMYYMIEHEPLVNRFTRFVYEEKDGKRSGGCRRFYVTPDSHAASL
ncbi:hypothetical protein AHF37_11282 [Paragonimus kellicotti]|nr:hypothetical protein AHF37_11282 [Paragonimus kellicotti]